MGAMEGKLPREIPAGLGPWYSLAAGRYWSCRSSPFHEGARVKRRWPHDGVYARIGYSRVHGVGVRAIRPIPAGTMVFQGESERVVWVSRTAVRRLPAAIRQLYEDFGMVWGTRIGVPPTLNMLSVGWYVNHSVRPNVEADDAGRFRALRAIRKGEELTADYRTFTDEKLPFKPRRSRRPRSAPKTGGKLRAGDAGR
jgi:hypothetical protein